MGSRTRFKTEDGKLYKKEQKNANPAIYDEQLRQYTISYEGIHFCWDEKPTDANLDTAKLLAVNYHKNIDAIVTFIYNEIRDWYGDVTIDEVKHALVCLLLNQNVML